MSMPKLLLTDLVSTVDHVPSNYIRLITGRPNLSQVHSSEEFITLITLIDLEGLNGLNHSHVVQQITLACQQDGVFQVKNHGVPENQINNMLTIAREFFRLAESERLKTYSDDPLKTTRLSTSLLHCYPLEEFVHEGPSNTPSFRYKFKKINNSVDIEIIENEL